MRRNLLLLGLLAGCNDPTYLQETRPLDTMMGMATMGMAANNGLLTDTALYVLPVRLPHGDEARALRTEQMTKMLKMPVPWAATRDFDVEIEWSLKNLEGHETTTSLTLLGGNEFGDYQPMLFINPAANVEDQTPPPPLLGGTPFTLMPGQVQNGIWREDELAEASLDLEAITRYPSADGAMSTPFEVIEHNSTVDRIGLDGIPANDVTPMMVRYQLNLSADGHVVCDYTVRVRDHNNKLGNPTDPKLFVSTTPTLAAPVNPMP
jgi:hypothetical protein